MTTKYITLSLFFSLSISCLNAMENSDVKGITLFDELKSVGVSKKINEISSNVIEISYEASRHKEGVSGVSFSPDGNYFATGSTDKTIKIYKVSDNKCKWAIGVKQSVTAVCWSPNSQYLIAGLEDGSLAVYDVENNKGAADLPYPNTKDLSFSGETVASVSAISSVCMSSDSKYLVLGTVSGNILLWNVEEAIIEGKWNTVKLDSIIKGHKGRVTGICFHFNNDENVQWFASCSVDKTIKVWEVEDEGYLFKFNGHTDEVLSICFSPDCTSIVSSSADKTIKIWDLGEDIEYGDYAEAKHTLQGHSDAVSSVRHNSDGTIIVSGSHDGTVKIWDVIAEPKKLRSLEMNSAVCNLDLCMDDKYILAGLTNGEAYIATLNEVGVLKSISDILHDKKDCVAVSIKEIFPDLPILTRSFIITALRNSNRLAYLLPQLLPSQNRM